MENGNAQCRRNADNAVVFLVCVCVCVCVLTNNKVYMKLINVVTNVCTKPPLTSIVGTLNSLNQIFVVLKKSKLRHPIKYVCFHRVIITKMMLFLQGNLVRSISCTINHNPTTIRKIKAVKIRSTALLFHRTVSKFCNRYFS